MPNHIRNVLKFKHVTPDDTVKILNRITSPWEEYGDVFPLNRIMDFDKIIPEPRTKEECPEDCLVNKDSHVEEDKDRPWFDWYTWHCKYWDTKWNAYDCYIQIHPNSLVIVFTTAWSAPAAIYSKLKDLGYDMEVRWADEDIGSNCGKAIYEPKKTGFTDWCVTHAEELPNAKSFARNVWKW